MTAAYHGTVNGYGKHKCRCDACRAAKSAVMARWAVSPKGERWRRSYADRQREMDRERYRRRDRVTIAQLVDGLLAAGDTPSQIAAELGKTSAELDTALCRSHRPDLGRMFRASARDGAPAPLIDAIDVIDATVNAGHTLAAIATAARSTPRTVARILHGELVKRSRVDAVLDACRRLTAPRPGAPECTGLRCKVVRDPAGWAYTCLDCHRTRWVVVGTRADAARVMAKHIRYAAHERTTP